MPRRDDEEFEAPNSTGEAADERQYIDNLRDSAYEIDSQAGSEKSVSRDRHAHRSFVDVRFLQETVEAKTALQSPAELASLKSLMMKYLQTGQFRGARIEILASPNPQLLGDLRKFCPSFKEQHPISFGIRLMYKGKPA